MSITLNKLSCIQRQPHEANNSVYSAPPPPLPYRPPPPNPYNLPYNNVNNNLRPSPTNMRLSPSPPSITGSTPPPHGGTHGGTPPCMATYARVSNLKKVINNGGMGHNNGGIVQQNQQITSQSQGNITNYRIPLRNEQKFHCYLLFELCIY